MSELYVNKSSPDFMTSGMERLRGPKAKTMEEEKFRLKKATQEFESFFTYQMLKTMRQTVPESPFAKDSPLSANAGKETFTDIFDMEIARKMSTGKSQSIADILYQSLEKLVQSEYESSEKNNAEIKLLSQEKENFIEVKKEALPVTTGHTPIPIESIGNRYFELKFQKETDTAQDLSKKPKAPAQLDDKEIE